MFYFILPQNDACVCVCVCVRACVRACARARARVCACVSLEVKNMYNRPTIGEGDQQ